MTALLHKWTPHQREELLKAIDEKRDDADFRLLVRAAAELSGFSPAVLGMHMVQDQLERFAMLITISLEATK